MTVCYLDVDDEITDAVARLRTTSDRRFILVLPPGSRVATSRINFRLLSREGHERDVVVGMVSSESGVRSLAISAGMPAYATVEEAESGLWEGAGEQQPPPATEAAALHAGSDAAGLGAGSDAASSAAGLGAGSSAAPAGRGSSEAASSASRGSVEAAPAREDPPVLPAEPMVEQARRAASARPAAAGRDQREGDLEATRIMPRSGASVGIVRGTAAARATVPAARGQSTDPHTDRWDRKPARARSRARGRGIVGWLPRLAVVAALVGGALYAANLYLPNVAVSLTPMTRTAGPLTVDVTADPAVAVADPDAAVVPAERIDIPLSATDQFPATGSEISETRASGAVRFTSENTLFEVPVPEGTRLTTPAGASFETTAAATLPQASFQSGPSTVDAPIRAVEAGPAGNVEAATITGLPEPITAQLVRVTNPEATSGGQRVETRIVTRADYDAAVAALGAVMDAQLAAALTDPEMTPRGLRLFPETAVREGLTTDLAAGDVVDQTLDVFSLSAESRGTVLAVDEISVAEVAEDRLGDSMPSGTRLFRDSVRSTVGEPRLLGGLILYEVEAVGEHYEPVDTAQLVAAIRGRTVSEARAILDDYGSVSITPWPDFIDTVPDDARRINLTVLEPQQRSP